MMSIESCFYVFNMVRTYAVLKLMIPFARVIRVSNAVLVGWEPYGRLIRFHQPDAMRYKVERESVIQPVSTVVSIFSYSVTFSFLSIKIQYSGVSP